MAAGDLVVADNQLEIRSTLTGFGTPYLIEIGNMQGLGVPLAKSHDVDLGHVAGAYLGRDYTGVRVITIPYVLRGVPATVGANFRTLCTLWAASESDITIHLRVSGFGRVACVGRPRGLVDDLSALNFGAVRALASFVCGDPTLLEAPGAPSMGTATAGVLSATANWTAPASTGGSAITGYTVTTYRASDGVVLFTDSLGLVLTFLRNGLTAGVGVYFKVAARNVVDTGSQSAASNTVTPT